MPLSGVSGAGYPNETEATGDGSIIAILKRIRTLIGTLVTSGTKITDGSDTVLVTSAGEMEIHAGLATDFEHFSNLDVDTAAEQLTAYACKFGVQIKADDSNSSAVYVGKSDVTAGTTDATDGFKLNAGQGVFVPVSNANLIYVIGGALNQKVWVLAI